MRITKRSHKLLNLTFIMLGAMMFFNGKALATPEEAIVGSWCVVFGPTQLVTTFNADGTVHAINGGTWVVSPSQHPDPSFVATPVTRTSGLGEAVKVGPREWEANYLYYDHKLDGTLLRRFNVHLPVVYDPSTDTISNGEESAVLHFVYPGVGSKSVSGSYTGKRFDKDSLDLCH